MHEGDCTELFTTQPAVLIKTYNNITLCVLSVYQNPSIYGYPK